MIRADEKLHFPFFGKIVKRGENYSVTIPIKLARNLELNEEYIFTVSEKEKRNHEEE